MSTGGHGGTPWEGPTEKLLLITDAVGNVVCTVGKDLYDWSDASKANAEFIVRACNAHDELVAALERYSTHANDCSVRQAFGIKCDCGLSDVFQKHVLKARGEQS